MSAGAIVTIIVAVIAAAASITGAIVAYRAAGRAANSSQQIARESHGVAAIDRQSDQLAEAFDKFVEAFADARQPSKQLLITARLDQLASCVASTAAMQKACDKLTESIVLQNSLFSVTEVLGPRDYRYQLRAVAKEYRNVQKDLSERRESALGMS